MINNIYYISMFIISVSTVCSSAWNGGHVWVKSHFNSKPQVWMSDKPEYLTSLNVWQVWISDMSEKPECLTDLKVWQAWILTSLNVWQVWVSDRSGCSVTDSENKIHSFVHMWDTKGYTQWDSIVTHQYIVIMIEIMITITSMIECSETRQSFDFKVNWRTFLLFIEKKTSEEWEKLTILLCILYILKWLLIPNENILS